jgi:hypothetical protein
MYLGVMYLSEICNMSGSELQTGIENNTHDKNVYNVTLQRPKQTKPNSYSWKFWKFWKKAIQSFTQNGKKLILTLGPWTTNHSRSVDGLHIDQKTIKFINLVTMNKMRSVNGIFTQVMVLNFNLWRQCHWIDSIVMMELQYI